MVESDAATLAGHKRPRAEAAAADSTAAAAAAGVDSESTPSKAAAAGDKKAKKVRKKLANQAKQQLKEQRGATPEERARRQAAKTERKKAGADSAETKAKVAAAEGKEQLELKAAQAAAYLRLWSEARADWKFNKVLQSFVLQHLFDRKLFGKSAFTDHVLPYAASVQGAAFTRLQQRAAAIVAAVEGEDGEGTLQQRVDALSKKLDDDDDEDDDEEEEVDGKAADGKAKAKAKANSAEENDRAVKKLRAEFKRAKAVGNLEATPARAPADKKE